MNFIYNDGGRAEAGYKGKVDDCTVRAIAIVTEQSYQEVYSKLYELNRQSKQKLASPRDGNTKLSTTKSYLESLGWYWTPTMLFGKGCKVHLKPDELPAGRLVVRLSKHLCAVIDGVLNDTYDCTREESRCVYGYFSKK